MIAQRKDKWVVQVTATVEEVHLLVTALNFLQTKGPERTMMDGARLLMAKDALEAALNQKK